MSLKRQRYGRADLEEMADSGTVLVNLGCGDDERGVGIDINYDPDIQHDLNDGIPLAEDSVDRLLAEHVLEHLDNPTQFLAECERVLRPDGKLELEIPNVGWLPVRLWLSQDLHRFWSHKDPERDGHWLARRLGNPDERRTPHRTLWTRQLLIEHLERAGFDCDIAGRHWSKNLRAVATPQTETGGGQTLHELERAAADDLASGDYWAQTRARILSSWVGDGDADRILDVGCGSGYLTAQLAREDPTRTVRGVDINERSIAVASQRKSPAEFAVGDLFSLEIDEPYDVVLFADVIEHFEDDVRVLGQAERFLRDDGRVLVSVPAFEWLWGPHDEHNDHERRYTKASLSAVASDAGYRVERARYTNLGPLPVYLLYQRLLERPIPNSARGGHGRLIEWMKNRAIDAEASIPWPVGITLLAELRQT